ncbi:hypothetical protein SprV_0501801100 [Sparganum proliferum]
MLATSTQVLVLGAAVVMPDMAGLNDVTYRTSPRVTICGSGSGQPDPLCSPATETECRGPKNHLHVLTNRVEPGPELSPSSTPRNGQRSSVAGSITELVRWTTKNVPKPPQTSFFDGLRCHRDIVTETADCLI